MFGHGREPSARLAGRPTWNRSATLGTWTSPPCGATACCCGRWVEDDLDDLIAILAEPAVARWWGPQAERPDREELLGPEPRFAIVVDGALAGWLACEENTDPMYRSVGLDIFLTTARQGQGLGREALRLVIAHYLERGHHRYTIDPAADNERAIRAYAAVGFKPVGRMRDYELGADGTWHDGLLMDLLAAEFVSA
jgi:aminoglycoside 6'-N-acetyltransferase